MQKLLAGTCVLAACYTGSTTTPPTNGDPLEQAPKLACGHNDDLVQPPLDPPGAGRMRTHVSGNLSANPRYAGRGAARSWVGGPIPAYIPKTLGTLELFVLDEADGGDLALYREPYDLGSCGLGNAGNCAYEVRFYSHAKLAWKLALNDVLSRPDQLEIQDIRLADGVLYFNEACQSYSADARGKCSSLVAVDPRTKRTLWRTEPLISNSRFAIRGCYIVAGYGFTAEPDALYLVERTTGKVRQKVRVSKAPEAMALDGAKHLTVTLYGGRMHRFELADFDTALAKLVPLDDPMDGMGGASYGGMGYGGNSYGGLMLRKPRPRPRP
jgi:hypothetical protein